MMMIDGMTLWTMTMILKRSSDFEVNQKLK